MSMTKSDDGDPDRIRPTSNPDSNYTYGSRMSRRFRMSADDMFMPVIGTLELNDFKFVHCNAPACATSSAFSQYPAMTLRAGFDTCVNHTTVDIIMSRTSNVTMNENTIFIFYDIEVTSSMEISELAAYTNTGRSFSSILRTSTRKNNSPIVSRFSPMTYMLAATEPRTAFENFITWVNTIMNETSSGTASPSDVVLVAHNGMCHDHVVLFKTMMMWGMSPPEWTVSDSLPIFKLVVRPEMDQSSKLSELASEYAPWFVHIPHDALSDATVLAHVVMAAVPNWKLACYVFSSSYRYFIASVGLNVYKVRSPLPFPSICD